MYSFMAALFIALFAVSCSSEDNPKVDIPLDGAKEKVAFSIDGIYRELGNKPSTKGAGNLGPIITDGVVLDSLIKNVRIFAFDSVGICQAYADYDPIRLSQDSIVYMNLIIGKTYNFVIATNITDPSVMPKTGIVGGKYSTILAKLKSLGYGLPPTPGYTVYDNAPQLFYYYYNDGLTVVSNPNFAAGQNKVVCELARIISQLETTIQKTQVFAVDNTGAPTGSAIANFITTVDSIYLYNTAPDVSMARRINNQAPNYDATNTVIGSGFFKTTDATKPLNYLLSFATEQTGQYPYIVIAATIDPTNAFNTKGTSTRRYWALQLKDNFLRENVRLQLDITRLLGEGSITPPPPTPPKSTVQFVLNVYDWDPIPDTEAGDAITKSK